MQNMITNILNIDNYNSSNTFYTLRTAYNIHKTCCQHTVRQTYRQTMRPTDLLWKLEMKKMYAIMQVRPLKAILNY